MNKTQREAALLPEPTGSQWLEWDDKSSTYEALYTADQMLAYGAACAAAERESLRDETIALLRELAGVEVLPYAPTYTEQQIADACMAAEVPDSKCESVLLALRA